MPRHRIAPGSVGPIAVVPIGIDGDGAEFVIPRPTTDGGEVLDYPKGLRVGQPVKVETPTGMVEFVPTRWRGLCRAVDVDGTEHMIRRWRPTKGAAEAATQRAAEDKLAELARRREAAVLAAAEAADGDRTTTVADLVARVLASPDVARLAAKTQQDYRYASQHITGHPIGTMLPREVDVAAVRDFLRDCAEGHGKGGTVHARAVLSRAFDLAVETAALRVPMSPVVGARNAIPNVVVRTTGIDHHRAPTDQEVRALLSGLTRDPRARAWYPGTGRAKARHGHMAERFNGLDVADLAAIMFATGSRIGEVAGLRWQDVDLVAGTVNISGTLTTRAGTGTVRQESTKTRGSTRVVPLASWARAALARRARRFGINMENPPASPVFGSPAKPEQWRDPRNLSRAVAELFARHGVDFARGHSARKWRVTSLAERGIPVHKIADLVGHTKIETTSGYLGRGRQTDPDVVAAL
ncbi:tyrosine-type recombinase/integrase [Nakamurella leprariae]|uniref:Site-specific integrase n=1 Tax=Nakamurella leprariae TaxID=2803911 RepID=A0A939BW45_9ACTN|nr:site-specific integrase [Nakamurella leprariae]MBM9467168.1 site-specific integrase [Nakamurella leprariae]